MANRTYHEKQALEKQMKDLHFKILLSAAAAVSSFTGKGIASVTKNGAGTYDIVLEDAYNLLLGSNFTIMEAAAAGTDVKMISEVVNSTTLATRIVKIKTVVPATGVATDVAAAITIFGTLHLRNISI